MAKVFANLAFIAPLVSHMADDPHEKWPSIDEVVKEFERVVSPLSKTQLRARLIPRERRPFFKKLSLPLPRWMSTRLATKDNRAP